VFDTLINNASDTASAATAALGATAVAAGTAVQGLSSSTS
jgi:hypothetical protein